MQDAKRAYKEPIKTVSNKLNQFRLAAFSAFLFIFALVTVAGSWSETYFIIKPFVLIPLIVGSIATVFKSLRPSYNIFLSVLFAAVLSAAYVYYVISNG